jgi:hypothetical protein
VLTCQLGLDVCGDGVERGDPRKTAECGKEQCESERAQRTLPLVFDATHARSINRNQIRDISE